MDTIHMRKLSIPMFYYWKGKSMARFGFVLVSVRTFGVMYDHTFSRLFLQITRSDIRPQTKWVVSLVIAYDHFNLP